MTLSFPHTISPFNIRIARKKKHHSERRAGNCFSFRKPRMKLGRSRYEDATVITHTSSLIHPYRVCAKWRDRHSDYLSYDVQEWCKLKLHSAFRHLADSANNKIRNDASSVETQSRLLLVWIQNWSPQNWEMWQIRRHQHHVTGLWGDFRGWQNCLVLVDIASEILPTLANESKMGIVVMFAEEPWDASFFFFMLSFIYSLKRIP